MDRQGPKRNELELISRNLWERPWGVQGPGGYKALVRPCGVQSRTLKLKSYFLPSIPPKLIDLGVDPQGLYHGAVIQ